MPLRQERIGVAPRRRFQTDEVKCRAGDESFPACALGLRQLTPRSRESGGNLPDIECWEDAVIDIDIMR